MAFRKSPLEGAEVMEIKVNNFFPSFPYELELVEPLVDDEIITQYRRNMKNVLDLGDYRTF